MLGKRNIQPCLNFSSIENWQFQPVSHSVIFCACFLRTISQILGTVVDRDIPMSTLGIN